MSEISTAQIKANLDRVQQNILDAAVSVGRNPAEVQLVVVSKTQPAEVIRAAYAAGIRIFGENYPQETEAKIQQLTDVDQLAWHMIGHLQSRKAAIVVNQFQMIHSIDSFHLAEKLDRLLALSGKKLPALLEVNLGGESSKSGWDTSKEENLAPFMDDLSQILELPNLKILGLMTMPPLFDNPEDTRPFFQATRHLRARLAQKFSAICWQELSMGTSADYRVAIQEGATMVRIGQAILGPRHVKPINFLEKK